MDGIEDIERNAGRARRFLLLATGFWTGPTRSRAWVLTLLVVVLLFWNLLSALAVNFWTKYFFDALERKDTAHVVLGIGLIMAIALASAAGSVGLLHART